ncbi:MAG: VTT domain-containing protein [Deltaproteobacteria bacterium]|nr:VTT domain-containing protein [Deltaproteobacteria bacterium]
MIKSRFHWQRVVLFILFAIAAFATVIFGLRTYRSFLLLRSAYELGAPDVSSVRPWMTLDYVARAYHVPGTALAERLGLPPDIVPKTTLKSLAERQGLSPFQYIQQVQKAISELRSTSSPQGGKETVSEPGTVGEEILAALLVYGYPVLGLTLLLGTVGAPFPSALSVVVAGSLIARGEMNWLWAAAVVVASSASGDLAGYGVGRLFGREFLERRGRWLGFTAARQARIDLLFQQWGILTVLLSRSLLSFLSSAVNLLAGASRYRLRVFLLFSIVGRMIWTSAYLGLGYGFGIAIEAAADFPNSLSGFLASLVVLAALGFIIQRNHARLRAAQPHSG